MDASSIAVRMSLTERVRLPTEEATHVVHALPILLFVYATHTWRRALVDIAKQAWPPQLRGPLEDAISTRSHSEYFRQLIKRLSNGPCMGVGTRSTGFPFVEARGPPQRGKCFGDSQARYG